MAAYKDWIKAENLDRITSWARNGLTDEQISKNIGISRATLYDWFKSHPEIKGAVTKGREVANVEVENALFKSATGYDYEETFISQTKDKDGNVNEVKKIYKKHQPPNATSAIFWLKNRKPDDWKDRRDDPFGSLKI